jgi:hypothetical protein
MRDKLIVDRLIIGVSCKRVKDKLMDQTKLDLAKAVDICRRAEATEKQSKALNGSEEIIKVNVRPTQRNHIHTRRKLSHYTHYTVSKPTPHGAQMKWCKLCKKIHLMKK